jgi:hypothetical protein
LLGEALALFFIGTLYPRIRSASRWKQLGWRVLRQEAIRQVRPDGIYFEQTLYYHVYALDFLLHARLLASRNNIEISSEFDLIVRRMLHFVRELSQVGPPDGFGDDDGGRLFDSSRNRAEHMTDPLGIGADGFHDDRLRGGVELTEEAIWLLGEKAVASHDGSEPSLQLNSTAFPDGGIYVITSRQPSAQQVIIDAGPQGTDHCGHGHADALSVRLSFAGRRWLVDAGTGVYIGPDEDRNIFRGTRAHNTLAVDGLDQAQPEGPFAWSSIPQTQVETYIYRPTFTLFVASHSGYERLPQAVRHRRFVFHFGGNLYLIRDVALGAGTHLLETSWHFAPDLEVSQDGKEFIAAVAQPERATSERAYLSLLPIEDSRWKVALRSEYVSPCYGEKISAPVLRSAAGIALPAETAMLLAIANARETEPGKPARLIGEEFESGQPDAPDAVYRIEQGNVTHVLVFSRPGVTKWSYGAWTSDAQLLHFRMTGSRIDRMVFCEGTFAHFGSKDLISHASPLQWFEWDREGVPERVACSEQNALQGFARSILL